MTEQPEKEVKLRLTWQDASDLPTIYANQMYVTHAGPEFYVVFGEVELPTLTNLTPDELADMGAIEVKPVAKLVFTPDGIVPIAKALVENIDRFMARQECRREEDS